MSSPPDNGTEQRFLERLLYPEMHPFWPLAEGNCFAGLASSGSVYGLCAATGFFGIVFWLFLRE
ncbi:MAG: hypothetical protein KF861_07675 [Planctomycetaceae bacterium]|nr:hypothetical protein [Planctomycetaceae bacterium]